MLLADMQFFAQACDTMGPPPLPHTHLPPPHASIRKRAVGLQLKGFLVLLMFIHVQQHPFQKFSQR